MDDQIRELAEQAGYLPDSFGIGHWDMPECKRFAELIIQECIEQIQLSTARDPYDSPQYIQSVGHIRKIKEHFGVK